MLRVLCGGNLDDGAGQGDVICEVGLLHDRGWRLREGHKLTKQKKNSSCQNQVETAHIAQVKRYSSQIFHHS